MLNKILIVILILYYFVDIGACSTGDNNQHYQNCLMKCHGLNCTADNTIRPHAVNYFSQSNFEKYLYWSCSDECKYACMWRTLQAFRLRGWKTPQFYGKWPFLRIFGLQEPASVAFSILNFIIHIRGLLRFRREVKSHSPCYKLWHIFGLVCINGWIWSTVFHARDFPLTELLDYSCAYSIVLVTLYCLLIRLIHNKSIILKGFVTALVLCFYLNYFAFLCVGRVSYSLHMKVNIITGILSGFGWIVWGLGVYKYRPYASKIITFYILFAVFMSLELLDFPPIFWIFDAHSLWHLSSVPLGSLFYSFMIADCKALHKESFFLNESLKKIS